jgi:aryl-alcohol dehydrogenase-like predicted oxidoreductase
MMPKRTAAGTKGTSVRMPARATAEATEAYAARWRVRFARDFYRASRTGVTISSIAIGTYLGESDDDTDRMYADAAGAALSNGVNVVDTAINYRCQRSERMIGGVLREMLERGALRREDVWICTKAGYIPLDGAPPASRAEYEQYLQREYFESGVLRQDDVVAGGHSISPSFLADQIQRSLRNMQLQAIDLFYIHNPEQQLAVIEPAQLRTRLRAAFESLEALADRGVIGAYGCATWTGLRLPAGSRGHLSLQELVEIAREVGGDAHRFRAVQLPINLSMSEAVRVSTQRDARGRLVNVLDLATELGIDVVASAPLLQGQLTHDLPEAVRDVVAGATDAQRALQFVHSLPAITTVAVGMRQRGHVDENLRAFQTS